MTEEVSWRSPTAYDYVEELDPSELAWEFLRRNTEYRDAYEELVSNGPATDQATTEFSQTWGLRFRGGPKPAGAKPTDFLDRANGPCRNCSPKRALGLYRGGGHP